MRAMHVFYVRNANPIGVVVMSKFATKVAIFAAKNSSTKTKTESVMWGAKISIN